jgi:secreted trypsin-like serine protease
MNFVLVIKVFLIVCSIFVQINTKLVKESKITCGKRSGVIGNIIDGESLRRGSFPWLVAFRCLSTNQFFCGGSLVSDRHIVSGEETIYRFIKNLFFKA